MMKFGRIFLINAALLLFVCGCNDAENNHPMLKKAQQSKRSGEYRNAELCYKKYLRNYPNAASVHLDLAQLYDEQLEDYLPAIYHYKEYLRCAGDSADIREINNFIERCEQKFVAKGRASEYKVMTDEEEITRMTEAYKKRLAMEQQSREEELVRLRAESEAELKNSTSDAAVNDSPVEAAGNTNVPAENKNPVPSSVAVVVQTPDSGIENSVQATAETKDIETPAIPEKSPVPEQKTAAVSDKKFPEMEDMSSTPIQTPPPTVEEKKIASVMEYKVQKGDTFTHLSRKFYGTTRYYKKLMQYNKITNPNTLRIGKIIKIPPLDVLKGESK